MTGARLAGPLLLAATVAVSAQAPDRSRPPVPGDPPELRLPPIQQGELSNGLPVWLVEAREVPIVQVDLLVRAGAADDPVDAFGVARMTATMLDEGAGGLSALELADAIEFLGASLTIGGGFDSTTIRLNTPVARLGDALPLLADVALRPSFPQEDLDRIREERLTDLLQTRDNPAALVTPAFNRVVFGPEHRYGISATGTEATLSAMTRQDLIDFHAAYFQPGNAVLVVVGDTTMDAVRPLLEDAFGVWRDERPVVHTHVAEAPQLVERQVYLLDVPGAAQSQIHIGWVGVSRSTPDYFALEVLNTVLGGSFTSRLNQNLREEHGYTYGAGSGFQMRRSAGVFVAAAGVQTDATAAALTEFFNEFTAILDPVPDKELTGAKNYRALRFPGDFETLRELSGHLQEQIVYDLPADYFERYVANIQAVTAADVQRAAERHIQPSRFAVVVVGDLVRIEDEVRALDLGPVTVMSVEEALGN